MVMNEPIGCTARQRMQIVMLKACEPVVVVWLYVEVQSNDVVWCNASSTKFYTILMTCNAAYEDNL